MNIGIDARLIEETGVGRYTRNLIAGLSRIDKKNTYVIFLRKKSFDGFIPPNRRFKKVLAEVPWHSVSEQLVMPGICANEHLDLLHVPYHNPPVLYPGRIAVTIHDLTILHFATGKATTLPYPVYALKRFGYRIILSMAIRRASPVIAVSETTKQEILDHFSVNPANIAVTYEGCSVIAGDKRLISEPYFLYVGNAYPHKNVETLLTAFDKVSAGHTLVLVGKDDYFYRRLRSMVRNPKVRFFGDADDQTLGNLYTYATAAVFPSFMEGFGLPAVEALASGCPVMVSDIPIFHEILTNQATYFDPRSADEVSATLTEAAKKGRGTTANESERKRYAARFSWDKMAKETLGVYERRARV